MVYVTSDLHGCSPDILNSLLKKANFSSNDFLFVLGDVIDRGEHGIELLKYIMLQDNIELILGNHEAMMLSCEFLLDEVNDANIKSLSEDKFRLFNGWRMNGAAPTIKALTELNFSARRLIFDYLSECVLYDTVSAGGKDFVLTHSGFRNFSKTKKLSQYAPDDLIWNRPKLTDEYFSDAITVFGHTPTLFFSKEYEGKIIKTKTWIDIDTGAAAGLNPALLRLDDLEEFYI